MIDSLSALLAACQERFDYRTLMHLFYRILKNHCCTTIMTCNTPTGQKTIGWGIEGFIAGALLIQKVRDTDHNRKGHNVLITKQGLEVVSFAQV